MAGSALRFIERLAAYEIVLRSEFTRELRKAASACPVTTTSSTAASTATTATSTLRRRRLRRGRALREEKPMD